MRKNKRDAAQYGKDVYDWWDRQFNEIGGGYFQKTKHLKRDRNKVRITLGRTDTIMGFDDSSGKLEFFLYLVGKPEELVEKARAAVSSPRLDKNEERKFRKIFGSKTPRVDYSNVTFDDEEYSGIRVRAEVREVPLGRAGGLSTNLLVYFRKGIIAPVYRALE
jgi:hypothetical protein